MHIHAHTCTRSPAECTSRALIEAKRGSASVRHQLGYAQAEIAACGARAGEPIELTVICGFNARSRGESGTLVYHGGRLIRLCEHANPNPNPNENLCYRLLSHPPLNTPKSMAGTPRPLS